MLAKLEVAIELCDLLLTPAGHLRDEEEGGDGEEEAGEGVEEEDVDAAHCVKHGLEEEGDQEPDEGAHKDGQRDDLVSDLDGKYINTTEIDVNAWIGHWAGDKRNRAKMCGKKN